VSAPAEKLDARLGAALAALFAAGFLTSVDRSIFAPLLPALAGDFGQTIGAVGLAVTAYTVPYGLFQLFYGPAGDRFGKIIVVRWTFLLFAIGTGLCGVVSTLPMLYLLRAITGASAAACISQSLAFIGDVVPYARRQSTITTLMGATSLGTALSTAMGGIVGEFLSWRVLFLAYGVLSLAVAAMLFRASAGGLIGAPLATRSGRGLDNYLQIVRLRRAQLLYLTVCLEGIVLYGGFTYLGAYFRDKFGMSYLVIGLILALYGVGTLLTSRMMPRLLHGMRETDLILAGGLFIAAAYLVLPLIRSTPLFIPPMLLMGCGFALFHSTLQTRATELAPGQRGTAVAIFAFSLFLGGGIGTAFFGWFQERAGYVPMIVGVGCLMAVISVLAWRTWETRVSGPAPPRPAT
jgi:predicted MFS family arabinose efflux permease